MRRVTSAPPSPSPPSRPNWDPVWAQIVLRWTKRKVTEAAQRALDPKVRRRNITLTVIGLVIIAALLGWYLWKFGIVMPWKIDE